MPPIEVGPASGIGAASARLARPAGETTQGKVSSANANSPATTLAGPAVETSQALDPGQPPIDNERVQLVRKAVETGRYPVVPAQIADAMIAAGVMLRSAK